MELNVISVTFNGFSKATTCGLYQWDYGQYLKAEDIELPQSYEVHFAQGTDTCTVLGDADGVQIPDEYLQIASPITAYIYLHQTADDGETVFVVTIPVIARPEPSEGAPTPVEVNIITQAIAALNDAVTSAPVSSVNNKTGAVTLNASDVGAYVKPGGGIPKNDLASDVQTSLGKADSALQSAPVTSVNGKTGAVTIGNATTSAAGLMSATDKSHLDDVYADYSSALTALGV